MSIRKTNFVVMLCFVIFLASCKKDDNPTGDTGGTQNPSISSMNGKIKNWDKGSGYTVRLQQSSPNGFIIGSSPIDSNGNFNIATLLNPPQNDLIQVSSAIQGCSGSMNISDQSLEIAGWYILYVYSSSKQYAIADLSFANATYEQVYCFTDKQASLNGIITCGNKVSNWNFSLKAGWNKVTKKRGTTGQDVITSNTIDNAEWILIQ